MHEKCELYTRESNRVRQSFITEFEFLKMPTCGCNRHQEICVGECGPVFKISNRKVKKETIEKLRTSGLLGNYANYVCQKCVQWVESGQQSGVKRQLESGTVSDIVDKIAKGSITEEDCKMLACALGNRISDSIYHDSVAMSDDYINPENLLSLDVKGWLKKRNTILTSFLMHSAKCLDTDEKKQVCIAGAVESLYKARNLKTVSPFAYSKNIIAYYMSHSKNIVSLFNSCRPAGCYYSIKKWLKNIGTIPLQCDDILNKDSITFFDNNQVVARNWRINYNHKCKASVITTTANIVLPTNLQKKTILNPSRWLYNGEPSPTDAIQQHVREHQDSFRLIRNQFLYSKLQEVDKNTKIQGGLLKDDITDRLEGFVVNKTQPQIDPYEWVPSEHLLPQPQISIGEPVMANPCSYLSVETVLKDIKKSVGVTNDQKSWCVIGCDGLPYTLGTKLIERNKDLQNILLIPGHGHIEINVVKAVFKLLWEPVLQDLSKECGFKSPRAQVCAQSCSDHHKAFMLLNIFFEAALQEIMTTFLSHCHQNSTAKSLTNFYNYINISEDKNFRFMCDVIMNYVLPILVYRAGVRRNNFKYIAAGKAQFIKLFFAFGMINYQSLVMKDIKMYVLAPPEVKEFLEKTQSFTVSGHQSKGEGGDFVLEAMNGRLKRWLPPGIPQEKHWQEVCRNADLLQKIRENTFQSCCIKEDIASTVYKRDISEEISQYRIRLRKMGYLSNRRTKENPHTSVTGDFLDNKLHLFESQMEDNMLSFMRTDVKGEFTPVFTTEAQRSTFYSVERKTKKQLSDIIEEGLAQVQENGDEQEAGVLRNMWVNVKSRPKSEMLHFYKEIVAALENSTGCTSSDDESCEEDNVDTEEI